MCVFTVPRHAKSKIFGTLFSRCNLNSFACFVHGPARAKSGVCLWSAVFELLFLKVQHCRRAMMRDYVFLIVFEKRLCLTLDVFQMSQTCKPEGLCLDMAFGLPVGILFSALFNRLRLLTTGEPGIQSGGRS